MSPHTINNLELIAQYAEIARIERMTVEIGLSEVIADALRVPDGKVRRRMVVYVNRQIAPSGRTHQSR